jgi:hypothetical protein
MRSVDSMNSVIRLYEAALLLRGNRSHTNFLNRLARNPESARAEATVFRVMKEMVQHIDVNEDPIVGGPDFLCQAEHGSFLLEVSSLSVVAVEKESGILNDFVERSGSFKPISAHIYSKAISKVKQLSGYKLPSVLAITTEHLYGLILLESRAAQQLLMGTPIMSFPINEPDKPVTLTTDFKDSVFYGIDPQGNIEHLRPDISAVLLFQIRPNTVRVVGIMNPMATIAYEPKMTPQIPFVCATETISNDIFSISVAWKNGKEPLDVVLTDIETDR